MISHFIPKTYQSTKESANSPDCIDSKPVARPFLKWAGGKAQLLDQISKRLPFELYKGNIKKYVEPFVGGGALFFYIAETFNIDAFYLVDINKELILAYQTIKKDVDSTIKQLTDIEAKYNKLSPEEQRGFYYKIRNVFNSNISKIDFSNFSSDWIERTAQLIFLNRTCFNGLFRVNSKSEFNVPFGRYKNPTICSPENLKRVSLLLQRAEILLGDFELCEDFVDSNTFVYFDPPYRPISSTSNFTSYSSDSFDEQSQVRLSEFFRRLDQKGAKLMLSNSDPKNENPQDNFFDDLYKGYRIERIRAKRIINCNALKRGPITEVLITNY